MKKILSKAYCINLDTRQDRWIATRNQFKKNFPDGFKLTRFSAFSDQNSRIGCARSHLELIRMAKMEDWDSLFVIEDDVDLATDSYPILEEAYENLPRNWDILLGGIYDTPLSDNIRGRLYKTIYLQGTHFLIYNRNSYDAVLSYDERPLGFDDFLSYLAITKGIDIYHIAPPIAWQRAGFSDIKKELFDWQDENHCMKNDYTLQNKVYRNLYEGKIEDARENANGIEDAHTKEQAFIVIEKYKKQSY